MERILERLFYCYSFPLKEFLINNNQKIIISTIHEKTKKKCWVFEGTKELNNLLEEWRLRKQ